MYGVSAEYISAMNSPIQMHRVKGTIGEVSFDQKDILADSLVLTNQCSDSKDLILGGVYVGTLKLTLLKDLGIERGTWIGQTLTLTFEQLIDQALDRWEAVPIGVFNIAEANHSEKGVELVCYDNMSKLDKEYNSTELTGTLFSLMTYACARSGVKYGLTEEETLLLPNSNIPLGIYPDNDCKTWRDVVHYLAQLVGGFATAGRDGKILLKSFGNATNYSVDPTKRLTGSKFSDYVTNYTGLSVVNMFTKETRYVHTFLDNGLTLNLGSNPLLQYGTEETLRQMLNEILTVANGVKFIPFSSSMVGNPAIDLGDIITYTDGTAGNASECCVMAFNWKFNRSYSVNGFGKNPSLSSAKSKAEKDISGLSQQSKADTVTYFTYENATKLTIDSLEQIIISTSATNIKETFVDFWAELKLKVTLTDSQAVLNFRYTIDDVEEPYRPVMTYNHDGVYILGLHYYWKLSTIMQHTFRAYLEVVGGTVEIEIGDIHAVVKGQGMTTGTAWNGLIEVSDGFRLSAFKKMTVPFKDDKPTIEFKTPNGVTLTDVFDLSIGGVMSFGFTDEITVITQTGIFELMTEDDNQLIAEDGSPLITNGGSN